MKIILSCFSISVQRNYCSHNEMAANPATVPLYKETKASNDARAPVMLLSIQPYFSISVRRNYG